MGKIVFVTGGARSGKSSFAEDLVKSCGSNILYIATSLVIDDEMADRVRKHRLQRPSGWSTLEAYSGFDVLLSSVTEKYDAVLLDCMTIMVTNLMFEKQRDWDNISTADINEIEEFIMSEVDKLINAEGLKDTPLIIVTNEVGMGLVPEYPLGRAFRDIAGRVNKFIASKADEAYFLVSGIHLKIK